MAVLKVKMKNQKFVQVAGQDAFDLADVPNSVHVYPGQALVEVRGTEALWESQSPPVMPTWRLMERKVVRARWVLGPRLPESR